MKRPQSITLLSKLTSFSLEQNHFENKTCNFQKTNLIFKFKWIQKYIEQWLSIILAAFISQPLLRRCFFLVLCVSLSVWEGLLNNLFTSDNGGGKCNCPRCLSVCLLARLLKNACMDFDDILRVDRCRDMDELINFWVRSRSYSGCWNRIAFSHSVCTATRNLLRWENPMYWYWAPIEAATHGF